MSQRSRNKFAAIFRRQKAASPEISHPEASSDQLAESTPSDTDLPTPTVPAAEDPILSLSPEETLDALRQAEIVPSHVSDQHTDAITKGIRNASATERALGVRAAVIGSKVRAWCTELSGWRWPGSFASPDTDPKRADEGLSTEGSLPPALVAERKIRIDAIYDELDILDIEELKDFVRTAHLLPSSRGSSMYEMDITAPSVVRYLDDFTTLITGTILMALPYVHRLNRLLNVWSMRALVLGQVPSFLELLWSARTAVDSAWDAIKPDEETSAQRPELSREAYDTMQAVLGARVTQLARTIDSMLDTLEGQQDTLPDPWIDLMESVQADYEEWVAIAERLAEEHTWQQEAKSQQREEQPKLQNAPSRDVSPKASAAEFKPSTASSPEELSVSGSYRALEASLATAPPLLPMHGSLRDENGQPTEENFSSLSKSSNSITVPKHVHPAAYMVSRQDYAPDTTVKNVETPRKPIPTIKVPDHHRNSDEVSREPSPPRSATSSSFMSDISEPQIMDASPVQLISYSQIKATPQDVVALRRDSEQTDRSFSTVRGSVDLGDNEEISRAASSLGPVTDRPETPVQKDVNTGAPERRGTVDEDQALNTPVKLNEENSLPAGPEERQIADEPEGAEEESEYEEESFIEPTREPRTLEEQLSNRIRTILANLPGRIRLSSHAHNSGNVDSQRASSAQSRLASGSNKLPRTRRSATPALTLAPAFDKSTPKVHSGNSEIKVYHLQSPDREKPIKLYVRLVGDEERVMVRVGGGWADLGDYLKDYAAHHGRRTASDARTEPDLPPISTPPRKGQDESEIVNGSSPASDYSDSASSRTIPALTYRKIRGAGSSALAAPPQTPDNILQRKTDALAPGLPESQRTTSDSAALGNNGDDTAGDDGSGAGADTGNGNAARDDSPVGLGGFKRNVELSPTKQAWVDGMLNQATRHASAEKEKTKFSELGKAGGTRRLFMRGKKDND